GDGLDGGGVVRAVEDAVVLDTAVFGARAVDAEESDGLAGGVEDAIPRHVQPADGRGCGSAGRRGEQWHSGQAQDEEQQWDLQAAHLAILQRLFGSAPKSHSKVRRLSWQRTC